MRKKPQINQKPNTTALQQQNQLEMHFVIALMNKDLKMLSTLICEQGTFFGGRNKWNVLHFFKVQFENWKNNQDGFVQYEVYVNMKSKCGHNTIMIDNGNFPTIGNCGKPKTLTLGISNNKISYIDICYDFISFIEADKMILSN